MENLGLSPHTFLVMLPIVLGAAVVKSTAGFGFGLVATPLLLLLVEPKVAVAISVPLTSLIDLMLVWQTRRFIQWPRVLPLALMGVAGVPLGSYVLLVASSQVLRLAIATVTLATALILLAGFSFRVRRERQASLAVGLVTGVLFTSTSISGPPLALFSVNQGWEKGLMRATIATSMLALEASALTAYWVSGVLSLRLVLLDLALVPLVVVGFLAASSLFRRMNDVVYHRMGLGVVVTTALVALASAFRHL